MTLLWSMSSSTQLIAPALAKGPGSASIVAPFGVKYRQLGFDTPFARHAMNDKPARNPGKGGHQTVG
jgi:hypothetical protein